MGKAKGSLVPMRGSIEDWGPGRHQRNLERKDAYARKMQEQIAKGPPDFEKLLSTGAPPPSKADLAKKRRAKVSKKKSASRKKSKKKTTKGRR
jgi:hypothetical protein